MDLIQVLQIFFLLKWKKHISIFEQYDSYKAQVSVFRNSPLPQLSPGAGFQTQHRSVVAWTGEHSSRGRVKSDQFRDSNRNRPFPGNIFLKMFVSRENPHFISYSICNAAKKPKIKNNNN